MVNDTGFRERFRKIKRANKERLAEIIHAESGATIDVETLFDVQVKRLHEYKRQLLNVLRIVAECLSIKAEPTRTVLPRTYLLGGKAAPGYAAAKLIIKLIHSVAHTVNHDPDVHGRLVVVFARNYRVSLAERIFPAADVSEQISTAGTEASGTGNMKFAMNGALTIGTLDGANVEIREEVGADNFFLFGLTVEQVMNLKHCGYTPQHYYDSHPLLQQVIDQIAGGAFSAGDQQLFRPIVDSLLNGDEYLLLADFQSYVDCQEGVGHAYQDQEHWTRMSILNTARMGKFSSDRSIREYARDIWDIQPMKL